MRRHEVRFVLGKRGAGKEVEDPTAVVVEHDERDGFGTSCGPQEARGIVKELPQAKVFMLTAFPGALDREKVAHSGLQGLLVKDQPAIEIIEAIRKSVETLKS